MSKLIISREQYNQIVAALAVCEASGYPQPIKTLVLIAATKGILGTEPVDTILDGGGKIDELVVVGEDKQISVKKLRGRTVVMEMNLE